MYGNIISSNIDIQRKEIFRKDFIMIFSIKNIGIIKSADVKMDGLTVISGANNSGKTTVGKALYSIVSATEDLKEKQDIDQAEAIYNRIRKIADVFSHLMRAYDRRSLFFSFDMETAKDIVEEIWYIKNEDYRGQNNFAYYKVLLYEFYEKIVTDEFLDLALKDIKDKKGLSLELQRKIKIEWKENKDSALKQCKSAMDFISSVQSSKEFALKMIDRALQEEFLGQVQSMTLMNEIEEESSLRLREESGKEFFNISLNDHSVNMQRSRFEESYFKQGYFVDDPYVIENNMPMFRFMRMRNRTTGKMSYTESTVLPHREKMNQWLKINIQAEKGISESLYKDKQIADVMEKINAIVPGNISKDTYIDSGRRIKVGNLATGSKVFSIIKNILEKGNIDEESLLVLDEPESHLHPRWINALAEVLVLLVKECNITVLLTTHSPNFLLAIDALMRKYDIRKNCHFYQTEKLEDDFRVQYVEKTDDLDEVYAEYARVFSQMNAMRKKYMASEES